MTAEIAVMNKMAIAMAADSAVTIHKGQKIFNSANKLFMLSRHHPVGIMIYGSAEIMDYPWETLIKTYRSEQAENFLPKISDYGSHFVEWIKNKLVRVPEMNKDKYYEQMIHLAYREIIERVRNTISSLKRAVNDSEIEHIFYQALDHVHTIWKQTEVLEGVPEGTEKKIMEDCGNRVAEVIKSYFGDFSLNKERMKKLSDIAIMCFIKARFSPAYSGIVIAGFGDEQDFPALVNYKIEGIINGWLKYTKVEDTAVNCNSSAGIIPFAQEDVVRTFLEGIEPELQSAIRNDLRILLAEKTELIINELKKHYRKSDIQDKEIRVVINSLNESLFNEFCRRSNEYKKHMHVTPVLQAIDALPIDELASAAEALVNLTSFKRRVSMDQETVGGPIDVAVISKGDGFIWIKRKHYFSADKNYHYFSNHHGKSYQLRGGNNVESGQRDTFQKHVEV